MKTPYLIAAVAALAFAAHHWRDVFRPPEDVAQWRHVLLGGYFWEDGATFLGIAGWLASVSRTALAAFPPGREDDETPEGREAWKRSIAY